MPKLVPSAPPTHRFKGELGPELVVLSVSIVRIAQRAGMEELVETADGPVRARVGDFIVTTADGERYPIPPFVFFGTYRVLGRVGARFVGRRLLHARRAWEVLSDDAEFDYHSELDYGPGRGKVAAPKGGWIYRSDENDYGYINPDVKKKAHVVVGTVAELNSVDWEAQFRRAAAIMSWLPPAMTLIALLAYSIGLKGHQLASQILLGFEGILLATAVIAVWWIRKDRWVLKSALTSGADVATTFQGAAQLLGEKPSETFPDMTLWRAAQDDRAFTPTFLPDALSKLKSEVSKTYERVKKDVTRHHATEAVTTMASWLGAGLVLVCVAYAVWGHSLFSELLAIWLPSAVGAIHSNAVRRQIVGRITAGQEFVAELLFVRKQLSNLVPDNRLEPNDTQAVETMNATLRVLCRAAAEHSQYELQFALGEIVQVPM